MTPELWTPNSKVHPHAPICPRCGGFDRVYFKRNRKRFGLASFHRACCCNVCSRPSLSVEFTGVNAGQCLNCFARPTRSVKVTELFLDGAYSLDFTAADPGPPATCEYALFLPPPAGATVDLYGDEPDCTGPITPESSGALILISILKEDQDTITRVRVTGDGIILQNATSVSFVWGGEAAFGESLPNSVVCSDTPNPLYSWSDSGFAVVTA